MLFIVSRTEYSIIRQTGDEGGCDKYLDCSIAIIHNLKGYNNTFFFDPYSIILPILGYLLLKVSMSFLFSSPNTGAAL